MFSWLKGKFNEILVSIAGYRFSSINMEIGWPNARSGIQGQLAAEVPDE
jgi:hypothetical protein